MGINLRELPQVVLPNQLRRRIASVPSYKKGYSQTLGVMLTWLRWTREPSYLSKSSDEIATAELDKRIDWSGGSEDVA